MTGKTATLGAQQSDGLLLIGAALIGAVGLAWLLISFFTGGGTAELASPIAVAPATPATTRPAQPADESGGAPASLGGRLDNPLQAARMAYEAGMLIEPEDYSAWTLYSVALEAQPDSKEARLGLERVATDLLTRASSATEQGRYADAYRMTDRILERLPAHEGAAALKRAIAKEEADRAAARRAPPAAAPAIAPSPAPVANSEPVEPPGVEQEAAAAAAAAQRLIADLHQKFVAAVAGNRLLAPADDSARTHLEAMIAANAEHELTLDARDWIVTEMLSRSRQSSEATDWDAARTWIDEAEQIGATSAAVAEHRALLNERLIAAEARKRLPASTLTVRHYVPPTYPRLALSRSIEGWVDVEFTVTLAGTTKDIAVTDASHDRLFDEAAVEAVSSWQFEPRVFLDQPIEQLVFTTVRFVFDD